MSDFAEISAKVAYNPDTGALSYRVREKWKSRGAAANAKDSHGYIAVWLNGKKFLGHRVAWLLFYGEWPALHIDHINGDRCDNRIANLRLATVKQNGANRRVQSSTGVHGVVFHKRDQCFQVQMRIGGKHVYLGSYDTLEEARAVRLEAERLHHGEFGHHASREGR